MSPIRLKYVVRSVARGAAPNYADGDVGDAYALGQSCVRLDGTLDLGRARPHTGGPPERGRVEVDDILITSTGHGTIGRAARVLHASLSDGRPIFADGHITIVRVDPARINSRFLAYQLGLPSFRHLAERGLAVGATKQMELAPTAVGNAPVWWHGLAKQRRIADFLDRESARIEALNERINAATALLGNKRADAIRQATSELGSAPLKFRYRVIDCKHRTPNYRDSGYPLVSTSEVSGGRISLDTATRFVDHADYEDLRAGGRDPLPGDIVFSRNASVGSAAYLSEAAEFCMGQDVVLITRRPRDSQLLAYCLNFGVDDQLARLSIGSTFKRINVETLRSIRVPAGTDQEERTAVASITVHMRRIEGAESALQLMCRRLDEYREALITEAVTGQLDISRLSGAQMEESLHAASEGERPEVLAS